MEDFMQYTVPRPLYEKLVEKLGDRISAESFVSSIEEAVREIGKTVSRETVDKMSVVKMEVKDDLSRTLLTRDLFEERVGSMQDQMNHRFESMQEQMDHRFESMQEQMDHRFEAMQDHIDQRFALVDERFVRLDEKFSNVEDRMDERFKRIDLKFNVLIGILLFGFTLFNPPFLEFLKSIMK